MNHKYHICFKTPSGEVQKLTDDPVIAESSQEAIEIWSDCIKDNSNGEFFADPNVDFFAERVSESA